MEGEILGVNFLPGVLQRLLPAAAPVLLTAIGYVDPGKWAAAVEGGAHFGFDLLVLVLVFNFAAILCQYLSAHIAIVTGRDLVQICHDEYDKYTCICLGVQAELSLIALDLTMILGIAHGLNLIFGLDLFTCISLTTIDAVLLPLFATFLENRMMKFLCISMAGFIMLFYVLGVLIIHPEIPHSMNAMTTKLSGESAFTLMSLLGASILPHNFYVHSYFVQQNQGLSNSSKDALCHDHFFAILCVFSGIFLVNYVLMNSSANAFHSAGLLLLTFQDVLSLMDQVFRSPIMHFGFLLVLLFSNQIITSTWNIVGRVVLHDFLSMDIPSWLHHATIRLFAIFPALYCVWSSGAEGVYQLLMFTQIMVALLLPSSVIPLFRIASSRSILGLYKISPYVEFLALFTFIGMLALKLIFVVEMVFGNSDWAGNLKWNMSNSMSVPYVVLLIIAGTSAFLMFWLLATPLKSASARIDAETLTWDMRSVESSIAREGDDSHEKIYRERESVLQPEPSARLEEPVASPSNASMVQLPETILEQDTQLNSIEVNSTGVTYSATLRCHSEELTEDLTQASTIIKEISDGESLDSSSLKSESVDLLETDGIGRELHIVKDYEGDSWGSDEASKNIFPSSPSLPSMGAGPSRSLGGKSDDGGNGAGSLSRLAGLGRAARRQLAAVLEEFWGQLYDYHGQPTQDAKAKKLDLLLGVDSKLALKVDTFRKEHPGYHPSIGGRASDSQINSSLYEFDRQQRFQSTVESSYGVQRGPSLLGSGQMPLLDACMRNSSHNALDSCEKHYSSLRLPQSSDGWDSQPATVHGYQIASYLDWYSKDKSFDYSNSQMASPPKSTSFSPTHYGDSLAIALGQNFQNGLCSVQASGYQNSAVSRNSQQQFERPYCSPCTSGPSDSVVCPSNSKKYHSLPDISGFSIPRRESYMSNRSVRWDSPIGFGPSVGQSAYQQPLYSGPGSRGRTSLAFNELSSSSSKVYSGSLWFRQPFEHFGVATRTRAVGAEGVESNPGTIPQECTSTADLEVKLLLSFRYCIVKLFKLEGSDWLFRQNDGADEDLIYRVVARERFLYESETREINQVVHMGELPLLSSDKKSSSSLKNDDAILAKYLASSLPCCGEDCRWRMDLIISFGVWCIRRVLELSLMESRPELWGRYTYVLNRLQGIIELAFLKPRSPRPPCFCFTALSLDQQVSSPPMSNGILPQAPKSGRGKCTTASYLLDVIKDVEIAISCRKGRQGTAAGDKAFPKGKENLGSVLKRYKRRLSGKQVGTSEMGLPGRNASHGL